MTGQKNRYTTTEKLWKLDDDTLETPAHEEMVLWLLDCENIFKLLGNPFDNINGVVYFDPFVLECSVFDSSMSRDIFENETDVWGKIKSRRTVEGNKDRISTWDRMLEDYNTLTNTHYDMLNSDNHGTKIMSETPITAPNGFLVGYTDIKITSVLCDLPHGVFFRQQYAHEYSVWNNPMFIEVKPKIKSFGETLRQLRTYEHYLEYTPMLFTTDMKFRSAFESQGIRVLTYPEVV
jgi:hypothetical protein